MLRLSRGAASALLPVALAAVLCAAVFLTGALDTQKVWTELVYAGLDFPSGPSASAAEGAPYGPMNAGPGFDLPPGTYRLKWIVEADGDNRILLGCENGARIAPAEIPLPAGRREGEASFTVLDQADGVQIAFSFDAGSAFEAVDLRLYSPFYKDHAFTLALLLAACALWLLHRAGRLPPEARGRLLLLGFCVLLASAPSLKDNLTSVYDTDFHLARLANLADALASGQFPARVGGFTYNGYGAATSVFYPDVFLYPFALLVNAGASLVYALHLYEIFLNIAAAAAMYALAKRVLGDADGAVCASALYTLAIYRVVDLYARCALGEVTAMSVLPVFLLGLWETLFGDRRRWPLLAAGAAGVCLSHALSTALCALLAVAACALCAARIVRERRFLPLLKAALLTALVCLFYLAPFAVYSREGIGADAIVGVVPFEPVAPAQLLLWGEGELPYELADASLPRISAELGLPLLLGTALALWARVSGRAEGDARARDAMRFLLAGAAAALAATTLFPWSYARALTGGLTDVLQFPWRFLLLADALLAVPAAYGFLRAARGRGDAAALAALTLSAIICLPTLSAQTRKNSIVEFGEGARTSITYPEYQLPGADVREISDRAPRAYGGATVTEYEKDGTRVTARVSAEAEGGVSLPLFGFTGYAAELDGERVPWTRGENARLTVALPAGTDAELRVYFAGTPLFRACDAVSLAALAALAFLLARMGRSPRTAKNETRDGQRADT